MDIQSVGSASQRLQVISERPDSQLIGAKAVNGPMEIASAVQKTESIPSMAQVKQAVQSINQAMQALSQNLEFSIDPDSKETIVKVIDMETKDVIRQIPTKETLEIAKALDRVQGLLIRQKA